MKALAIAALLATSAAAQAPIPAGKLPVPGDASHELQLYDLAALIEARGDESRPSGPAMAEFARAFVEPSLQSSEDIKALGAHHLVGLGRAEVHGWVHGFLRAQLEHGEDLLDLQFRVLSADDKALARAELHRDPVILADEKAIESRLTKLRSAGLLGRIAGEPKVTEVTAPRLLTSQLQRAHISMVGQTSYIKGYELASDPAGDEAKAVPQREIVQDGVVLKCRAALVQKDRVGLMCGIEFTELERPIPEKKTPHGPIGVPVVHRIDLERELSMPAGGGVLLPVRRAGGRHLVVLITATPSS